MFLCSDGLQIKARWVSIELLFRWGVLCSFGLKIANPVFSPRFAIAYKAGDVLKLQSEIAKSIVVSLAVGVFISAPWLLIPEQLVNLFFGAGFSAASTVVMLIVLAQLLNCSFGPIGILMSMTHQERYFLSAMLLSLMVNIASNFLLIPNYGAAGSALASLLSITVWNIIAGLIVYGRLKVFSHAVCLRSHHFQTNRGD